MYEIKENSRNRYFRKGHFFGSGHFGDLLVCTFGEYMIAFLDLWKKALFNFNSCYGLL